MKEICDLILEELKKRLEPFGVTVKLLQNPWGRAAEVRFQKIVPHKSGLITDAQILRQEMMLHEIDLIYRQGTPKEVAKDFSRSTAADVIFDMMDLLSESKEAPNVPQNA